MTSKPSAYTEDLGLMITAEMPWSSIRRYALLLETQGLWEPQTPIGADNQPLAVAYLKSMVSRSQQLESHLSEEQWKDWFEWAPDNVWSLRLRSGTLAEGVLNTLQTSKSVLNPFLSPILWNHFPEQTLRGWRGGSRDLEENGVGLLGILLTNNQLDPVRTLLKRGWSWRGVEGKAASNIESAEAFELFLETGGDLFQEIQRGSKQDGDFKTLPLWRYLLEKEGANVYDKTHQNKLREVVSEWAKTHVADGLETKRLEDYWNSLGRRSGAAEVQKAVRAHPDWPTLKNREGQSPLVVALHKNMSAFEGLAKTSKALPALQGVDRQGWGVWHHALSEGKKLSSAALSVLKEKVPARLNPDKGLLVTLFAPSFSSEMSTQGFLPEKKHFQSAGSLSAGKKDAPSSEDWWAGSPEQLENLARCWMGDRHYLGSKSSYNQRWFDVSNLCESISALAHAFPPPSDAPDLLRGALAINELLTASSRSGDERYALFDQLFAQGAVVEMTPKFREKIDEALTSGESLSRLNGLLLNVRLSSAEPASRPRTRL